jgi:hypothetical protein
MELPSSTCDKIEAPLPILVVDLMERVDPRFAKPNIDTAPPIRLQDRTLTVDPARVSSRMETVAPNRLKFLTEIEDPIIVEFTIDACKNDPADSKPIIDKPLLSLAKDRREIALPT